MWQDKGPVSTCIILYGKVLDIMLYTVWQGKELICSFVWQSKGILFIVFYAKVRR